jgi:hypothetical protein
MKIFPFGSFALNNEMIVFFPTVNNMLSAGLK